MAQTTPEITTIFVDEGVDPRDIAVNPLTNSIFVSNAIGATMTVINGATMEIIQTIEDLERPRGIAVNLLHNQVYVTSKENNLVYVIQADSRLPERNYLPLVTAVQ